MSGFEGEAASPPVSPSGSPAATRTAGWALGVVIWGLVAGYVAGRAWMLMWEPPTGLVAGHVWYPDPWDDGTRAPFGAIGSFVAVAVPVGLLTGVLAGLVSRGRELVMLAAALVGSGLAVWVMCAYGLHVSPPDPSVAAKTAADGVRMVGSLTLPTLPALAVLPVCAVATLCGIYLVGGRGNK